MNTKNTKVGNEEHEGEKGQNVEITREAYEGESPGNKPLME